jgi:hypothetical protein
MPETPRLALPLLAAGQSQKDVTHNDALLALDRLVALVVASRSAATPPASPMAGECHIVPAAGAAAWGHPAGTLMHWQGSAWLAQAPRDGQMALVADDAVVLMHAGGWQLLRRANASVAPALPSGGATVDSEARTAFAGLVAALQQQGLLS